MLICFEIEHAPWTYFKNGSVDAILWPGHWGWTLDDKWPEEKQLGKPNQVFMNMISWQMPILQSNFSQNDLDGHKGAGPEGGVTDSNPSAWDGILYRVTISKIPRETKTAIIYEVVFNRPNGQKH